MKYLKSSIEVINHFTTFTGGWVAGGWVGGVPENGNKAISASIWVEVELSWVEAELGNNDRDETQHTKKQAGLGVSHSKFKLSLILGRSIIFRVKKMVIILGTK